MKCCICPATIRPVAFDLATEVAQYKCPHCGTEFEYHMENGERGKAGHEVVYVTSATTVPWLIQQMDSNLIRMQPGQAENWVDALDRLGRNVFQAVDEIMSGKEIGTTKSVFRMRASKLHPNFDALPFAEVLVNVDFYTPEHVKEAEK